MRYTEGTMAFDLKQEIIKRPGAAILMAAAFGSLTLGASSWADAKVEAALAAQDVKTALTYVRKDDFNAVLVQLGRLGEKVDNLQRTLDRKEEK